MPPICATLGGSQQPVTRAAEGGGEDFVDFAGKVPPPEWCVLEAEREAGRPSRDSGVANYALFGARNPGWRPPLQLEGSWGPVRILEDLVSERSWISEDRVPWRLRTSLTVTSVAHR